MDFFIYNPMITFKDFITEKLDFKFEHDVEKEFDIINKMCFNNEIKKIPIEFVTNKRAKMFVDITARKDIINRKYIMTVVRLCISKNFHFNEQQFKDALTHEMIHVLLAQRNIRHDFGGQHGMYFKQEMRRINDLNVGVKVGLFDDENISSIEVRDELKGNESKRVFYVYLQKSTSKNGVERYNLTPFSKKEHLLEFWNKKIDNLDYVIKNLREYNETIFDICMGETKISDVGIFPISRLVKTAKLFVIDKDKYDTIIKNTTVYETKILNG